jgi:hypothetical protein
MDLVKRRSILWDYRLDDNRLADIKTVYCCKIADVVGLTVGNWHFIFMAVAA